MACPERFELPTLSLEVTCSIQLSYGQIIGGGLIDIAPCLHTAVNLVLEAGIEPASLFMASDFKSDVFTYFTTRANFLLCHSITKNQFIVNLFILVPRAGVEPT